MNGRANPALRRGRALTGTVLVINFTGHQIHGNNVLEREKNIQAQIIDNGVRNSDAGFS